MDERSGHIEVLPPDAPEATAPATVAAEIRTVAADLHLPVAARALLRDAQRELAVGRV
jgi:hypothetical protein